MTAESVTRCCIAGGGPAGMMLGLLLARAGIDVVVLEKHGDFLRDFRGDTIHPSTLELMHELGALDEFLALPHQEVRGLSAHVGGQVVPIADFTHLPTRCRFLAIMPQWDFLNFLASRARARYRAFQLWMSAEVTEPIEEDGRIVGVRAVTERGPKEVRADLVVAADGRRSAVRAKAGLAVEEFGAPMDVLWFRLSRHPDDPAETMGYFDRGRILVMINRGDYWQFGYVIPKGRIDEIRAAGIEALRERLAATAPYLRDRVAELGGWDHTSLLTVQVDRLARWYRPGLLCIGDAAHAMSPVGGVGINLAVQDAVAAAKPAGRAAGRRSRHARGPRERAAPPRVAHARHPVAPAPGPEADRGASAERREPDPTGAAAHTPRAVPVPAAHPRPPGRPRRAARAHRVARGPRVTPALSVRRPRERQTGAGRDRREEWAPSRGDC